MLNVDKVFTTKWTTLDKIRNRVANLIAVTPGISAQEILNDLNSSVTKNAVAVTAPFADFQTGAGVVIPDTPSCVELSTDLYKDALGNDIDTTTETHIGRMIEQTAKIMASAMGITAANIMQYDITSATGAYLDALASLFLISRKTAKKTSCVVNLECTHIGETGTFTANPTDTSFTDVNGVKFVLAAPQTFKTGAWSADCKFICETEGAVVPELNPSGSIIWNFPSFITESSQNVVSYEIGYDVESDESLRARLVKAKAQSKGFLESVYSNLTNITGVYDARVIENCADTTNPLTTIGGVPMEGHSICVIVDYDGTDQTSLNIAKAIFQSKAVGCGYAQRAATETGMIKKQVSIEDDYFGNEYEVTFYRPSKVGFKVDITVSKNKYYGSDLVADVKSAIMSWANGDVPFVDGIKIGQSIKAFEIGAAVSDTIPEIQIDEVKIATWDGTTAGSWVTNISVNAYQIGVITSSSNITVHTNG